MTEPQKSNPPNAQQDLLQASINTINSWVGQASSEELDALRAELTPALASNRTHENGNLSRKYPKNFRSTEDYKAGLPDLQNGPASLICGVKKRIEHVGVSNFRLPVRYRLRDSGEVKLPTSVTGSVSLDALKKGINMSRIMRSFYRHAEKAFSLEVIEAVLADYKSDLESVDARLQMRFAFPVRVESLRSGLIGYQYYDMALEVVENGGGATKIIHLDYVYSSTCPCSLELAEHARTVRGQLATPHSQRSVARISIEANSTGELMWFEDLIEICRDAVPTETQVMVMREDEQAFAELNAANPMFVEDAGRLFCQAFESDTRIGDYRVIVSHQESLHSHDAIAILTRGPTFSQQSLDPRLFDTLFHVG